MAFIHLVRQEIVNYMNTQIKISTLIITAVSALLFYASFVIGDSENYLFPRLIAGTIAALTLLLYLRRVIQINQLILKTCFQVLL